MTDWWAKINEEGGEALANNFAAMARAQNDVYMVCSDASVNGTGDNTLPSLEKGTLTRGELQRNAANICRFLLHTHAIDRLCKIQPELTVTGEEAFCDDQGSEVVYYQVDRELVISLEDIEIKRGTNFVFALDLSKAGGYRVEMSASSDLGELAQIPVSLIYQGTPMAIFTFNGTQGRTDTRQKKVVFPNKYAVLRLFFIQAGLKAKEIKFTFERTMDEIPDMGAYVRS